MGWPERTHRTHRTHLRPDRHQTASNGDRREVELYDAFRDALLATLTPEAVARFARDVEANARAGDIAAIAIVVRVLAADPDPASDD